MRFYDEYKKLKDGLKELSATDPEKELLAAQLYDAEQRIGQLEADLKAAQKAIDAVPTNRKTLLDLTGLDITMPTKPFIKAVRKFVRDVTELSLPPEEPDEFVTTRQILRAVAEVDAADQLKKAEQQLAITQETGKKIDEQIEVMDEILEKEKPGRGL